MIRKAWRNMDTIDRVVCIVLSVFSLVACGTMAVTMSHSWSVRLYSIAVGLVMAYWPWIQIPADSRRLKITASICGDDSGPRGIFCTLEPGHRGDHKNFRSNGGMIGWPRKAGE